MMIDYPKNIFPWIFFIGLSILLRFFSFFPVVLDHDESTYIVIGKALMDGDVYLVDVIDTKPIGIFWLYGLLESIFGKSIFGMRFFAAIIIGLTSGLLFKISFQFTKDIYAAWASGIIYIVMISLFKSWGLSPNTELYFNLFSLAGILILLTNKHFRGALLSGLLFGIAFHIKYVSLSEASAIVLFLAYIAWKEKKLLRFLLTILIPVSIGFMAITSFVLFYYYYNNALDVFWLNTFNIAAKYSSKMPFFDLLIFFGDYFFRFFFVSIPAILFLVSPVFKSSSYKLLFYFWLILDLLIITIPGKYFEHYFIQLMPVTSLLAGMFLSLDSGKRIIQKFRMLKTKWLFISIIPFLCFLQWESLVSKDDKVLIIKNELEKYIRPDESFYSANAHHILYFLLDKKSPSAYIHSSLLWNEKHRMALGIDASFEINKILSTKPEYILINEPIEDNKLKTLLLQDYKLFQTINERTLLYKHPNE